MNTVTTSSLPTPMVRTRRKSPPALCLKFHRTAPASRLTPMNIQKRGPGPERHIAIADLGTGKVRILKEIPSDNCFGPVWSPDASKLAFSIMAEKEWHLGLVNADGSGFRFVTNAELNGEGFGWPTWSRDGKSS